MRFPRAMRTCGNTAVWVGHREHAARKIKIKPKVKRTLCQTSDFAGATAGAPLLALATGSGMRGGGMDAAAAAAAAAAVTAVTWTAAAVVPMAGGRPFDGDWPMYRSIRI